MSMYEDNIHFMGIDVASRKDFTSIVIVRKIGNKIKLVAVKELQTDYTLILDFVLEMVKKFDVRKIWLDATGAGIPFMDILKSKNPCAIEGITLTNPMKVTIMETLVMLMDRGKLRMPLFGAGDLKKQILDQQKSITKTGLPKFEHSSNRHDDLLWALALVCYGLNQYLDQEPPVTLVLKRYNIGDLGLPESRSIEYPLGRIKKEKDSESKSEFESLSSDTLQFREEQA